MTDTTTLTDEQKSVMLAKLCGLKIATTQDKIPVSYENSAGQLVRSRFDGGWFDEFNLYDPANMALAWRVLNWVQTEKRIDAFTLDLDIVWTTVMPPADAQRTWLDKILSLAIEAGLVEE